MTRILSLDDCPEIVELTHLILARAGYEHVGTTSNEEALSILRSEPIDLFTEDIMRPHMDGWDFYCLMQSDEKMREIPVLVISASSRGLAEPTFLNEVDGYITKPFGPRQLLAEVRRILQMYAEPPSTKEERARGRLVRESILRRRALAREEMIRRSMQLAEQVVSYLPNARVENHNVLIEGQRAKYQVSLDTGQALCLPNKRLCIVPQLPRNLPNACLPFEDVDIRTRTILSIILMLAADQDIRDEAILRQLR